MNTFKVPLLTLFFPFCLYSCSKRLTPQQSGTASLSTIHPEGEIHIWLTEADKSALFAQSNPIRFNINNNVNDQLPAIEVDSTQKYQQMEGFGFCLTDGSAYLINRMKPADKMNLIKELFSTDSNSIGISYIRISIGASDLSQKVYTYDDLPEGEIDTELAKFSINENKVNLIPVIQLILKVNPEIKILGSPWSAPSWMKDNKNSIGGSLEKQYYKIYADYFVRYIKAMKAEGINIEAITPQNEPLNPKNNPSMYMSAEDEKNFIKNNLGPAFAKSNISTKIICYDHNADVPGYPLTILKDSVARQYVDGSAFHLYAGDISALTQVHNAFPDKNIYFTEQYTGSKSSFEGDFSWAVENLIIGAVKNWSKNVLEWNLASDPELGPHTEGGCTTCLGAVTINENKVTRNQSYFIIAHASKFVRPGSYRILSGEIPELSSVAFLTPDGGKVLILINKGKVNKHFNIKFNGKTATTSLNPGAVATYIW